ncbi:unnamed protein product [Rhizoctonia solani]|uniref:Uncharacterized protein n=1 Tax=Rhizoctonia solani TaxID=456999 RepID=A0A8H3C2X9_9AGAM|nr:unnamed protein product [Rhizoctonia solani]
MFSDRFLHAVRPYKTTVSSCSMSSAPLPIFVFDFQLTPVPQLESHTKYESFQGRWHQVTIAKFAISPRSYNARDVAQYGIAQQRAKVQLGLPTTLPAFL